MNTSAFLFEHPWILIGFALWDLVWNGFALYKSARNGQTKWFVALLVVNSLGILPIVYLWMERRKHLFKITSAFETAQPVRITKRTRR